MQTRRSLLLAAAALAAAACGANFDDFSFGFGGLERATKEESHELDLAEGDALVIEDVSGDVKLRVVPGAKPRLESRWTGFGADVATAQDQLDRTTLEIARTHDALRVSARTEPTSHRDNRCLSASPTIDLTLVVPRDISLDATTSGGDVSVEGPVARVRVVAPYGDIRVTDATDSVVESSSGKVVLRRIRGTISATTSYDAIEIDEVEGPSVRATTSSGSIRLRNAYADVIELTTAYDDIVLEGVEPCERGRRVEVLATTSSGSIRVDSGTEGRWRLTSSYGDVVARELSGTLQAHTSSGAIRVEKFRGDVSARTDYDGVRIEGELHSVEAETSSGRIQVTAGPGSAVDSTWRLSTQYDDVILELPENVAADLTARTAYGRIVSDFPLDFEGDDDRRRARGTLGGGGERIQISTSSGEVKIRRRSAR